jgi:hypothetical protein
VWPKPVVLEDEGNVPVLWWFSVTRRRNVASSEEDLSAADRQKAGDRIEQSRLAGA